MNLTGCWADVQDAITAGIDRIILYGPPGTGKTYAGLNMGTRFSTTKSHRLICTEDMTAADVTGNFKPNGNGTWSWQYGSVIKAWKGDGQFGGRIVADEIDKASGDILALLLAMFDTVESASWEDPETGYSICPLEGFSVVMTTNIEDMSDLPTALRDRFPVAIRINEPHPEALLCLPQDLREAARKSADAEIGRRFSIRAFQSFHQLRQTMELTRAAKIIFGKHHGSIVDALKIEALS